MGILGRIVLILTGIYVIALLWIIIFKMSIPSEIIYLDHLRSINFIPFYYDEQVSSHFSEVIENVLVFIPLGLYLRMLKLDGGKTVICGLAVSLICEIAQFILGIGATDITDLITNTVGTGIGVGLYAVFSLVFKDTEKLDKGLCFIALICTGVFGGIAALLVLGQ